MKTIANNRILTGNTFTNNLLWLLLLLSLFNACSDQPTSPYVILKETKPAGGALLNVQIYGRLNKKQLVAIASKIKKDSAGYNNLQIDYLLPGNSFKNLGGVSVYATAAYHDQRKVTAADTVRDLHDNFLSFAFAGFTAKQARHLLSFNPPDSVGKTILGKFIDDDTKTVSILYRDKDPHDDDVIYILELDTAGKVVSATQPMEVTKNGVQRLIISPKGDYCTLINGTLTLYSSDDPNKPYRTLKEGM